MLIEIALSHAKFQSRVKSLYGELYNRHDKQMRELALTSLAPQKVRNVALYNQILLETSYFV